MPSAERRPRRLTRRSPRRGGGSSPCTHAASAAGRPAGLSRLRVARHSLVGSARGLAAAALLALSGALALPTTAQAQEIPPGLEVTLHLSDDAVLEDATPITVTATASPASPVPFTVEISASPVAPATADEFELSTNRTLSFAAGATGSTGTVTIRPVDDEEPELPDVVTVSGVVSNPAIPNPDDVTLTIQNNAPESFDVAIDAPAAVDEDAGTATVTYTLTKRDSAPVAHTSVILYHQAETATRGADYTPPVGELSGRQVVVLEKSLPPSAFSPNAAGTAWVAEGSFTIGIVDDEEAEKNETIVFYVATTADESPEQTSPYATTTPTSLRWWSRMRRNRGTPTACTRRSCSRCRSASRCGHGGAWGWRSSSTIPAGGPGARWRRCSRTSRRASTRLTIPRRSVAPGRARHMHFEYKVKLFDRDVDGVSIGANALRVPSGARILNGEVGGDARLDHAAVGPLSDHKVDGSADVPVIERIEVVSTPRLRWRGSRTPDTYGEGENIRIEVRFDQPVQVEGEPTMALEVGDPCGSVCEARYESGSGTDTLVFAYLVLEVDLDRNGIAIPADPIEVVYGDSVRNDADQEAHLSFRREGTQSGHKVDGSRAAGPYLSVEDAEAHEADRKMDFTVRLEPHGLGIVTVDYATRDGSARAGSDYTETSGTLRFNSREIERTVSVPITDDAHEDDGETFKLRLSNPEGAGLRSGEREATGTIRNSDPEATPLTASFEDVPSEHDGESAFTFRVAFSEDIGISFKALREDAFTVTGGRVTGGKRVDGRRDLFRMTVRPDSDGDVTITLPAGRECGVSGAICTKGENRRQLSNTPSATVAGPADDGPERNTPATGAPAIGGTPRVGEELTASTSDISDADGLDDARFAYQWIRANSAISGATGSAYTAVEADEGERLKVRVSFTDDAGNAESLTSASTDAVAARPVPLTAEFVDMPAEHRGEGGFTFRVAFSEDIGISFKALREDAFTVTGGRVTSGKRVDGRRDLFRMVVRPDSDGDVTIMLPAGRECGVSGAICTKGENRRQLTNSPSATVRGPVGIAVSDAHVEEDAGAVLAFAVTLSRAASRALTVDYATSDGSAQAGVDYTAASGTLTFQAGESSKTVEVGVLDDAHDEGEETLTLMLSGASGGLLTDGEATRTIENRDPLPRALCWRGSVGRRRYTWSSTWRSGFRRRGSRASGADSRAANCGAAWSATWRSTSCASSVGRPACIRRAAPRGWTVG